MREKIPDAALYTAVCVCVCVRMCAQYSCEKCAKFTRFSCKNRVNFTRFLHVFRTKNAQTLHFYVQFAVDGFASTCRVLYVRNKNTKHSDVLFVY